MAQSQENQQSGDEWEDVVVETKKDLLKVGDVITGKFLGWSETPSGIPQAHFTNEEDGAFFVNCGTMLKQQLKGMRPGWLVRIEKTGEIDTGQPSPMTVTKTQFKRR